MSFESLTNRGEYLSAHYLAEILPTTLKGGLLKQWAEQEKAGEGTPRTKLRGMRRQYFDAKTELTDVDFFDPERLRKQHQDVLRALGFDPQPQTITVERNGQEYEVRVAHAELTTAHGIVALDCGWAVDTEAAQDPDDAGRLLDPLTLSSTETIETGAKLASLLFAADSPKPRYVLILSGGVITLADRTVWGRAAIWPSASTPRTPATTTRNSTSSPHSSAPTRCAHRPRVAPNPLPTWSPAPASTPWACPANSARA